MAFLLGYMAFAAIIGSITMALGLILACCAVWRIITMKLDTMVLMSEIRSHLSDKEHI